MELNGCSRCFEVGPLLESHNPRKQYSRSGYSMVAAYLPVLCSTSVHTAVLADIQLSILIPMHAAFSIAERLLTGHGHQSQNKAADPHRLSTHFSKQEDVILQPK